MRAATALSLGLFVLFVASCSVQDTPPQSQIDRLRVLSVQIEGQVDASQHGCSTNPNNANASTCTFAELAPGQSASLTALVLAPGISTIFDMTVDQTVCMDDYRELRWDRGGPACPTSPVPVLRFWFFCPPQGATLFEDPCTSTDVLAKPSLVLSTPGIEPLGAGCGPQTAALPTSVPVACVTPSAELFQGLAPDALPVRRGVLMSVLLLSVIDEDGDYAAGRWSDLINKVDVGSIPAVLTLKRVPVLGQPANHNPQIASVFSNSGLTLRNGDRSDTLGHHEDFAVSASAPEDYLRVDLDGTTSQQTEQLDVAWLSGFGRFDSGHTLINQKNWFDVAKGTGIDLPPPGTGNYLMPFVAVLRDGRGGESWLVSEVQAPRP
ncbi:MAG TPA: hypothetical protein VMK12_30885 [Anaeromyxobacteraceae bacterium]|nr:hypothetical protein [Anaeromyxobacteraceae bacterium]